MDEDGRTVVAKIVPGGAADKYGKLKKDDQIISVGQGESGEMVDDRRHEAQRRREDDPRQSRHLGATGRDSGRARTSP